MSPNQERIRYFLLAALRAQSEAQKYRLLFGYAIGMADQKSAEKYQKLSYKFDKIVPIFIKKALSLGWEPQKKEKDEKEDRN